MPRAYEQRVSFRLNGSEKDAYTWKVRKKLLVDT